MSCNCRAGASIFHQYEAAKWSVCEGDNPSYKFRANFLQLILLLDSYGICCYQFVYFQTIKSAAFPFRIPSSLHFLCSALTFYLHSFCVWSARDGMQMFPCCTQTGESAFPNKTMKVHFNICTDVLWAGVYSGARGSRVKGGSDSLGLAPSSLQKQHKFTSSELRE